ncbi:hypothetical protein BDZ91DRAFT_779894 [Kalaharituber pfeilii]|nr:hypothetical protein BDZ91DRAFT_779894 [Kalaharituber pfeilii]
MAACGCIGAFMHIPTVLYRRLQLPSTNAFDLQPTSLQRCGEVGKEGGVSTVGWTKGLWISYGKGDFFGFYVDGWIDMPQSQNVTPSCIRKPCLLILPGRHLPVITKDSGCYPSSYIGHFNRRTVRLEEMLLQKDIRPYLPPAISIYPHYHHVDNAEAPGRSN